MIILTVRRHAVQLLEDHQGAPIVGNSIDF
jgi:hypothetical protein